MWSFQANAGSATFNVQVQKAWEEWAFANLDAQLTVYDAAGNVVGAPVNPAGVETENGLGIAAASVALPAAGTYYVAVTGAGNGDPKDGVSYSSYGSSGSFTLGATFPAPGMQQQQEEPSPSPSPTPDGSTSSDGSSSSAEQQQPNAESPSPSPDPQPVDDTPAKLALISQFPEGVRPLFSPALWAVSARDNCIKDPSAQVGIDGVAAATPGESGTCANTVLPGTYTLDSGDAPYGLQLARWQCYDISDGFLNGPATGENVFLEPGSITSCVAVFEAIPVASPSPAPVEPSPSPEVPNTYTPEQPSPSPSPNPDTQGPTTSDQPKPAMRVSQIIMGKSCGRNGKVCSCTAKVMVVVSATGKAVRGASVTGVWWSTPETWAPATQKKQTYGKNGAHFTAQRQQSGSCLFAVTNVSSAKYVLDRSLSVRNSVLAMQERRSYRSGAVATQPAMSWPSPKP
jgi:uncharacterized Zn-binding protein involved in type VI secretion